MAKIEGVTVFRCDRCKKDMIIPSTCATLPKDWTIDPYNEKMLCEDCHVTMEMFRQAFYNPDDFKIIADGKGYLLVDKIEKKEDVKKPKKTGLILTPCSPCICSGAPCEQCMFGYRSAEDNHKSMKRLIEAVERGEKPFGYQLVDSYKIVHSNWREQMEG